MEATCVRMGNATTANTNCGNPIFIWVIDRTSTSCGHSIFYASRFDGGDSGRMTYKQFLEDQNFSPTPYNNNWVDRYTVVLRHEHEFGDGWLLQVKGWFTHQEIDARTAPSLNLTAPNPFPSSTTFGHEEFNNGGADIRFRKLWGTALPSKAAP